MLGNKVEKSSLDFGNSEAIGEHKENGISRRMKLKSGWLWLRFEEIKQ